MLKARTPHQVNTLLSTSACKSIYQYISKCCQKVRRIKFQSQTNVLPSQNPDNKNRKEIRTDKFGKRKEA